MIARAWSGRTKKEHAEAYAQVVLDTGIAGMTQTPGNRGAWVLRRVDGEEAEFLVVSFWDLLENIKAFAGAEVDRAKYYPQDDPYLLERAKKVVHYDVVHSSMTEPCKR